MPFKLVRDSIELNNVDGIVLLHLEPNIKQTAIEKKFLKEYPQLELHKDAVEFKRQQVIIDKVEYDNEEKLILMMKYPQKSDQVNTIRQMYKSLLRECVRNDLETVVFPLFPNSIMTIERTSVFDIVQDTITDFLMDYDLNVHLIIDDVHKLSIADLDYTIPIKAKKKFSQDFFTDSFMMNDIVPFKKDVSIYDIDESFVTTLFRLIDESGHTDPYIYRKANIDRKLFSKIRSNRNYKPSKKTALALAIALELDYDETQDLLSRAGYTLSKSLRFDVIVEHCLIEEISDIHEINRILFKYDQELF